MGRVYDLQAWHRARREHLTHEPMCRMCAARGIDTIAEHVDHITPVNSGGEWFDGDNLQSLCAPCHSAKTRADEGKAVHIGCGLDGAPIDPTHPWNANGSR